MRFFALALIAGTFVLQNQAELPTLRFGLLGVAALLAAALVPRSRRAVRALLLLAAGAWIGYGYAAWRAEVRLADALPRSMEGEDVEVVGIVAGLPQVTEKGVRFVFDVEGQGPIPSTISLSWYAERVKGGDAIPPPKIIAGQRWRLTVRLKRTRGYANPHAFDFEPWALERGIRATGYVRTKAGTALLAERVDGWPQTLHRWRGAIRDDMVAHLGEARLRGVLVALAIGDQDAIAADDWEVFWRTGVGHLMSISGLHITMLAALFFMIAFAAWVRVPAPALRIPAAKGAGVG